MRGQWRVDRRCEMNLKSGFKGSGNTKPSPPALPPFFSCSVARAVTIITSRSVVTDIVSLRRKGSVRRDRDEVLMASLQSIDSAYPLERKLRQ